MANYNEEMATLFGELGLTGFELKEIPPEDRATPEEIAALNARIFAKSLKNDEVLARSEWIAEYESRPAL